MPHTTQTRQTTVNCFDCKLHDMRTSVSTSSRQRNKETMTANSRPILEAAPRGKTPIAMGNKQVMSFAQLQQEESVNQDKRNKAESSETINRSPLKPNSLTKNSSSSASPLQRRIRHQILFGGQNKNPADSSSRSNNQDFLNRFPDKCHKEADRKSMTNVRRTPTDSQTGGATKFFTPSPTFANPRVSSYRSSSNDDTMKTHQSYSTTTKADASQRRTPPLMPNPKSISNKKKSEIVTTSGTRVKSTGGNYPRTPLSPQNTTHTRLSSCSSSHEDDGPSTRRNLDKRSARLKYSQDFGHEIERYMTGMLLSSPLVTPRRKATINNGGITVYVRKRPIFESHVEAGDFDVVQILENLKNEEYQNTVKRSVSPSPAVVIYRTLMAADMKEKLVQPVVFADGITAAFDDTIGSERVYKSVLQPLVRSVLHKQQAATLLLFGQTGSGKTYTMTAFQKLVSSEIFSSFVRKVQVQCIELSGKRCRDLMQTDQASAWEVRISDNEDGSVTFANATTCEVDSSQDLVSLLARSQARRTTQATQQNQVSSRSHAVFQIKCTVSQESAGNYRKGGTLTLLDCAGTERRNDSIHHSKDRQVESAEINASLYALKECIRVRTRNHRTKEQLHIPYRSSNLTRILREGLECPDARLAVLGTISPNATDTEHTIQTLKTVCNLTGAEWFEGASETLSDPRECESLTIPPKKWNHKMLVQWLADHSLLGDSLVPEKMDGSSIMRMSKLHLRNALFDTSAHGTEQADKLFRTLRQESDRVTQLDMQRRMRHS